MKYLFSAKFEKQYRKLPQKRQDAFDKRFDVFRKDPRNRSLNLHTVILRGERFVNMNVTGDCRALFTQEDENIIIFHKIGTHSQLYG